MNEPSSNTLPTAWLQSDPGGSSWRTSQASLLSEEHPLLERLPDSGTTADGRLYEQATPEHLINVRAGSVLPSLPTPAAWDGARGPDLARANRPNSGGMDLVTVTERLLPTPTSRDHKGRNQRNDDTCLHGALEQHTTSAPTEEPSSDGNTSSDGEHPPQSTTPAG